MDESKKESMAEEFKRKAAKLKKEEAKVEVLRRRDFEVRYGTKEGWRRLRAEEGWRVVVEVVREARTSCSVSEAESGAVAVLPITP